MDYNKLSGVLSNTKDVNHVSDSARNKFLEVRKKLADSVQTKDKKTIIDAAIGALKDNSPESVIRALVSLLGKKDSVKRTVSEIRDSQSYQDLKKKIKDEFDETESTEDALEVVNNALENSDPAEVVSAAVEILAETIDLLQDKIDEEPAPEALGDEPGDDYIEDSVSHKGKLRVKDSFCVGELFEGNGVKGKIKEVKDDSIVVESTDDEGNVEDKEISIEDIK